MKKIEDFYKCKQIEIEAYIYLMYIKLKIFSIEISIAQDFSVFRYLKYRKKLKIMLFVI